MQYLSVATVAQQLGVGRDTVLSLIKRGEVEAIKLGDARNASVRISEDSFREYLERRTVNPEPEKAS